MRVRVAIPDEHVTPDVLHSLLEATTLANQRMIAEGQVPLATDAIRAGVRWRPEGFTDGEHFDLGALVAKRGWGDCDDLAPWLAGELRATGDDPGARAVVRRSGPNRWHAVVATSDGQVLDPSRWAGMRSKKDSQISGAIARPMCMSGIAGIAVQKHRRGYAARTDLPWTDSDAHVAVVGYGRTPEDALRESVYGATLCGEAFDSHHAEMAHMLCGDLCGDDEEVGFLPLLASAAAPMASSVLSKLMPGKGGAAPKGDPAGGGMHSMPIPGGAGTVAWHAGGSGPVIVRF